MAVFKAKLSEGKIVFGSDYNDVRFRVWAKNHEGKWVRIELVKNPVSEQLRGYYFAAVIPTVKAAVPQWKHLKADDVHEILKKMFNSFDFFNPITKRTERVGRTAMSSDSNTSRGMDFIEKIREWLATEYLVELPNPEEYKILRDGGRGPGRF